MLAKTLFCTCQSRKFAGETENVLIPGKLACGGVCQTRTTRSGSCNGNERSSTPFTTEKIARARVGIRGLVAKPGALRTWRTAYRTSCSNPDITSPYSYRSATMGSMVTARETATCLGKLSSLVCVGPDSWRQRHHRNGRESWTLA